MPLPRIVVRGTTPRIASARSPNWPPLLRVKAYLLV